MSKRWGTPTWYFFHTLAEKIHTEHFRKNKKEFIDLIITICNNLPCPICKDHSMKYIRKSNIYKIQTKEEMKNYLYVFHNWVNKKLGKSEPSLSILNLYKKMDFMKVYKFFIQEFFKSNALSKNFFKWNKDFLYNKINVFLDKHKPHITP